MSTGGLKQRDVSPWTLALSNLTSHDLCCFSAGKNLKCIAEEEGTSEYVWPPRARAVKRQSVENEDAGRLT